MPKFDVGVENLGTPTGDRASLEQLAKRVNEQQRLKEMAERKLQKEQERANKANGY